VGRRRARRSGTVRARAQELHADDRDRNSRLLRALRRARDQPGEVAIRPIAAATAPAPSSVASAKRPAAGRASASVCSGGPVAAIVHGGAFTPRPRPPGRARSTRSGHPDQGRGGGRRVPRCVLGEASDPLHDVPLGFPVEVGRRLVEQQQRRVAPGTRGPARPAGARRRTAPRRGRRAPYPRRRAGCAPRPSGPPPRSRPRPRRSMRRSDQGARSGRSTL